MTERLAPAGTAMPPARTFTTGTEWLGGSIARLSPALARYSLIASATK